MTGATHSERSQYITEERKQIVGYVNGIPYMDHPIFLEEDPAAEAED